MNDSWARAAMLGTLLAAAAVVLGYRYRFEPPRYAVVALDAGVPIDSVTLTFPGGVSRVSEVSLFE